MSVIGWIILGLIAGFIGSKIVDRTGQGILLDIVLGITTCLTTCRPSPPARQPIGD